MIEPDFVGPVSAGTLTDMDPSRKIAVLVSKEPRPLQQLIADLPGQIAVVLSNHPDLETTAANAGLPFAWTACDDGEKHFSWLLRTLREQAVDLVVLARYMRILPPQIVAAFPNRIINIHPSLLAHFPGAAPYKEAFDTGVRLHGCTAHFVTEQLDEGPIITQDVFQIDVGADTVDDIKRKGLELEARVLSRAVDLCLNDELRIVDGKVISSNNSALHLQPAS